MPSLSAGKEKASEAEVAEVHGKDQSSVREMVREEEGVRAGFVSHLEMQTHPITQACVISRQHGEKGDMHGESNRYSRTWL